MSATLEAIPSSAGRDGAASLPARLLELADEHPHAVALRMKELGRWRETTWSEYAARAEAVGRGLLALGVDAGDPIGIVADNRPEWLVADLAAQGIGATTVAAFATGSAEELSALFARAGVKLAIAGDEEQLDKLLETRGESGVERVVVIDTHGIRLLAEPASSFEALEALGGTDAVTLRSGDVDAWRSRVAGLAPDAIATIAFTPGTTDVPKGVTLTHANLVAAATAGVAALGIRPGDEILSSLPLAEIAERSITEAQALVAGCSVNFGEGAASLANDLREVEPTVFLGVPRLWEYLRERVEGGARNAGRIKRTALRGALGSRRGSMLFDVLVRGPLRRQLGLGRLRIALTGTAPVPPDLVEWWQATGVSLRDVYGLTETGGAITAMPADDVRAATVGKPVPGVELRVDGADGELLVRGPSVSPGYLDDPETTRAAAAGDGWFRTGDLGRLADDGYVELVGRHKDLIVTSTGTRVSPRALEHRLEASNYVQAAVVVGEGRPSLGALLVIDGGAVGDWAAANDVPYTTFESLTTRPEVHELIGAWVDEINATIDQREQVGCFALLPSDLTFEDGALTATFKVRRDRIAKRYAAAIDRMYREREQEEAR